MTFVCIQGLLQFIFQKPAWNWKGNKYCTFIIYQQTYRLKRFINILLQLQQAYLRCLQIITSFQSIIAIYQARKKIQATYTTPIRFLQKDWKSSTSKNRFILQRTHYNLHFHSKKVVPSKNLLSFIFDTEKSVKELLMYNKQLK